MMGETRDVRDCPSCETRTIHYFREKNLVTGPITTWQCQGCGNHSGIVILEKDDDEE